jgi:hypothetical protein
VTRVMTDDGACYRSGDFADTCKAFDLKHIRTKPYTPKTNGKVERFIQTALREWAYARAYPNSEYRKAHLPEWTHMYNWHRPHGAISSKTPISRLALNRDNVLRFHTWDCSQYYCQPRRRGKDVSLFRFRGHGCPGPTRIEAHYGRAFEQTYDDTWSNSLN